MYEEYSSFQCRYHGSGWYGKRIRLHPDQRADPADGCRCYALSDYQQIYHPAAYQPAAGIRWYVHGDHCRNSDSVPGSVKPGSSGRC